VESLNIWVEKCGFGEFVKSLAYNSNGMSGLSSGYVYESLGLVRTCLVVHILTIAGRIRYARLPEQRIECRNYDNLAKAQTKLKIRHTQVHCTPCEPPPVLQQDQQWYYSEGDSQLSIQESHHSNALKQANNYY
jgi:hypothetical protein